MNSFTSSLDIVNRGLQHLGATRVSSLTQNNTDAAEMNFIYNKVRQHELSRNFWIFSTRRAALRPISATTLQPTFATWSGATTYARAAIVTYDGGIWQNDAVSSFNETPGTASNWKTYFGPLTAEEYSSEVTYWSGELVYVIASDGSQTLYVSMIDNNTSEPGTIPEWDSETTYLQNQTVEYSAVNYRSIKPINLGNTPPDADFWSVSLTGGSGDWVEIDATLANLVITYPIGATWTGTSYGNIFRLPAGFLRTAPQSPRAGSYSYMGAPTGPWYLDWIIEGNYLRSVAYNNGVILFRFVADIVYVPDMDPRFCEGLATRMAFDLCERLTQSNQKKAALSAIYKEYMGEAREVNAIEVGEIYPPEDDFVTCRY